MIKQSTDCCQFLEDLGFVRYHQTLKALDTILSSINIAVLSIACIDIVGTGSKIIAEKTVFFIYTVDITTLIISY